MSISMTTRDKMVAIEALDCLRETVEEFKEDTVTRFNEEPRCSFAYTSGFSAGVDGAIKILRDCIKSLKND